jgi:predicted RNase H-like HicB family nuclease
MSRFVALVDGHAGAYGVVVPDLPGCSSGGATIGEALINAQEAASLCCTSAISVARASEATPGRRRRRRGRPRISAVLRCGLLMLRRGRKSSTRADRVFAS